MKTPSKKSSAAAIAGVDATPRQSKSARKSSSHHSADLAAVTPNQTHKKHRKSKLPEPKEEEEEKDSAEADDTESFSLFYPSTAARAPVAAIAAEPVPAASSDAEDDSAEADGNNLEDADSDTDLPSFSSPAFLSSLLRSDAPLLESSLNELTNQLKQLRKTIIKPITTWMKEGTKKTDKGMSYLELKNQLLLQYLQHLVLFIMCKLSRGESQKSDSTTSTTTSSSSSDRFRSIVLRLIYLRTVLEKLRPLDKKLRYQIEKMIKLSAHTAPKKDEMDTTAADEEEGRELTGMEDEEELAGGTVDPLSFRPNPAALLGNAGISAASTSSSAVAAAAAADEAAEPSSSSRLLSGTSGDGIYRPPRLASTSLTDLDRTTQRRERELRRHQSRVASSSFLQHVRSELSDRPEEEKLDLDMANIRAMGGLAAEVDERTAYEERNLMRLALTRKDKAALKARKAAARGALTGTGLEELEQDLRDGSMLAAAERDRDRWSRDEFDPMRMEELARDAMMSSGGKKRKGMSSAASSRDELHDFNFDDPAESRYAKKRRGPNGKNPYGTQFKKKGKGKGRT